MIVIDSSFWIEYFAGTKYGIIVKENEDYINNHFVVPTIVVTKVFKKLMNAFDEKHSCTFR